MHQSIRTLDNPEFINLQPLEVNPLMSKTEIKILYTEENRNRSYISKEVATEMAKTLRGCPIVGAFKEEKGDFTDHGERVIIDDEGVKFNCVTKPYGFVAPDAEVWFQKYEERDEFGQPIVREYLMTTGYLWTGQYEEAKLATEGNGRPQSMELDKESLQGNWTRNANSGIDFFIINDAIFSKLCILGEDVEPCFEGAKVSSYTMLDDSFKQTLFTMMQDLMFALQGGQKMNEELEVVVAPETEEAVEAEFAAEETSEVEVVAEEAQAEAEQPAEVESAPEAEVEAEFVEKKKEDEEEKEDSKEESDKEEAPASDDEEEDEEKKKFACKKDEDKKYSLLQEKYNDLEIKYNELKAEYSAYRLNIENAEKDSLIESFYILSDEDKADVVSNKENYSLEEIESKLCVIAVRKGVNFNLNEEAEEPVKEDVVTTFNLASTVETMPGWVAAIKDTRDNRK